jgi:hypothetical protein
MLEEIFIEVEVLGSAPNCPQTIRVVDPGRALVMAGGLRLTSESVMGRR